MSQGMRIAFAGTPELAAVILGRLLDEGAHTIRHVFTQPDRPAGRGRKITASPVKSLAEKHGLPVSQPQTAAELETHPALADSDVLVVAAFGLILPETAMGMPHYGSVNVHTSLLPRWRGAAPIQRAIEAGDRETGITIMQMDAGLDTGPILLQKPCPIHADDTAGTLHDRLAVLGADCLLEALDRIAAGDPHPVPQDERQATYARKISKAEAAIDWSRPAIEIERKIRAFNPVPVAHSVILDRDIRIWRARALPGDDGSTPGTVTRYSPEGLDMAAGKGRLRILELQLPGKKPTGIREFYSGHPDFAG